MRPVIARRRTSCHYCKAPILPGSDRLDDVIRAKDFYIRIHYHPQCFSDKSAEWFEENRDKPYRPNRGGGRPALDLLPAEATLRQKLLTRLSALVKYYTPKLNLQTPPDQLEPEDIRVFTNFAARFQAIAAQLGPVGGLPPRYQDIKLPRFVLAGEDGQESEASL